MRVGVVCPYDLARPGGVQGQVVGLAAALRCLGHEVEVIAPGRLSTAATTAMAEAGYRPMGRSIAVPVNGSLAPMAPHPSAAWRTRTVIRRGRFDVLHVHEPMAASITLPALTTAVAPIVATFHAAGERTPYRLFARPLRRLAERIDHRVAVSQPAADLAARYLGGSYEVLFNGVDLGSYSPRPAAPAGPPAILFVGRHEPRKGLEVLVRAHALLPGAVELWVAGEGPETERLRRAVGTDRRVRWLGRLSEAEKRRRLAEAAVLCAPSLGGESFGVVLLEAMAAGTPVVASDLLGYRSFVGGSGAAVFVPPGDAAALAQGLARVIHDQPLAERTRRAGSLVARQFSFDALARRYEEQYEHARAHAATRS